MNTVTKHIVTTKAIIAREKELCQHIDAAIEEWSKQAQQTQQYMKALEYVKMPPTPHTSNRWTVSEYGNHEMSNMVYRFSWREYERTEWDRTLKKSVPKSWELTWSVTFNTPHNPDYSGDGWKIAGQDRKVFRDRASMEKYLQGRIAAYLEYLYLLRKPTSRHKAPVSRDEIIRFDRYYYDRRRARVWRADAGAARGGAGDLAIQPTTHQSAGY